MNLHDSLNEWYWTKDNAPTPAQDVSPPASQPQLQSQPTQREEAIEIALDTVQYGADEKDRDNAWQFLRAVFGKVVK